MNNLKNKLEDIRNELALKIYERTSYSYDPDREIIKENQQKTLEAVLEMVEEIQDERDFIDQGYSKEYQREANAWNRACRSLKTKIKSVLKDE